MIILGIDPGYAIIGYGVLEYSNNHFKVLGYGAITTKAGTPFNERLEIIYRELDLIMTQNLQIIKLVVGYGRAEKKQVQEMMRIMLKFDEIPKPDDTADALAMAICHAHTSGSLVGKLKKYY